jgi:hypothetical protein
MASKLDPDGYGEAKAAQVNISIGDLHLQALKQANKAVVIDAQ